MNTELHTTVQFQLDQVESIAVIIGNALRSSPRVGTSEEGLLLAHSRILTAVLAQIAEVLAREPRRIYGGGLDQPSP